MVVPTFISASTLGVFLTDSPIRRGADSIFSFSDEAEILLNFAAKSVCFADYDAFVDPFCGPGHVAISMARRMSGIGFDVNPRAISMARLNARLHNTRRLTLRIADACIATEWVSISAQLPRTLVLGNPPFAPWPFAVGAPIHSASGRRGDLILARTLRALACGPWCGRALILTLALAAPGRVSVIELAQEAGFDAVWHPLDDEPMWRPGVRFRLRSPAALDSLIPFPPKPVKGAVSDKQWRSWIDSMKEEGFYNIEYGILDVVKGI